MNYPATTKQRRAGMAAFRAKLRAVHERFAADSHLSEKECAYQRELANCIKKVQQRFGEDF